MEKKVEAYRMSNSKPMVEVRDVHKAYGALEVLKGINLSVERGQIIAIIGPSGSGKVLCCAPSTI